MNTFGRHLRLAIFGDSHGPGIGIVVDGVPPGLPVDDAAIQARMQQRRPGQALTTSRSETDHVHIRSGVFEGHTTGAPVMLWIGNEDVRSQDYEQVRRLPRPGHSDLPNSIWARGFHDPRGGGHSSGRLTAPLVAAAALLSPLLAQHGVEVAAHLHQAGAVRGPQQDLPVAALRAAEASPVFTAHGGLQDAMVEAIEEARRSRDSIGGAVAWRSEGVPPALGDPFFDSVESRIAHLLFAVPAVKAVQFGQGVAAAAMRGSQHNDAIVSTDEGLRTVTNSAGGILGGRTTGMPLLGEVTIKPTSSIFLPQQTVDLATGEPATLELKGRHDPCIAVRAVPVVRACVELVLADFLLQGRAEGHVEVR